MTRVSLTSAFERILHLCVLFFVFLQRESESCVLFFVFLQRESEFQFVFVFLQRESESCVLFFVFLQRESESQPNPSAMLVSRCASRHVLLVKNF